LINQSINQSINTVLDTSRRMTQVEHKSQCVCAPVL